MGGWLRHRPGDVGVTARATTQECTQIGGNGLSVPFWGICVHCCAVALLWTTVGTQECTQIGGNGLSVPFWGVCVHCCAVVDNRGDAGVYTNRWKWPLGAILGHLCTLLRRESRYESRRELRQVARAPQPPRRAGGASSLVPLAWSENQALSEWRRCSVGIFAKTSTHTNPRWTL